MSNEVKDYRDLRVWQHAMDWVTEVYSVSREFPKEETYGLTSQLRRAAVSVPANIAEGASRQGPKEFLHFLSIARGSLAESSTLIVIAERLAYLESERAEPLLAQAEDISRMLTMLRRSLSAKN